MKTRQAIENEGWKAAKNGWSSSSNPYIGIDAYYWEKGYADYLTARCYYS